jgi:hypothetical protein
MQAAIMTREAMLYPDAQANAFPPRTSKYPPFSGYSPPVQIIATDETGAVFGPRCAPRHRRKTPTAKKNRGFLFLF